MNEVLLYQHFEQMNDEEIIINEEKMARLNVRKYGET